jgi:transcription initiation factor IIF auxiliary subunit
MKELYKSLSDPVVVSLVVGLLIVLIPTLNKMVKTIWKNIKNEVRAEISSDFIQKNEDLEKKMLEQITLTKGSIDLVKEALDIMRRENELSHKKSDEILQIVQLHIDQLSHVQNQVDDVKVRVERQEVRINTHEIRIVEVEKDRA